MIIVSDTSPISNLILIDELNLLNQIFHIVYVPPAVDKEIRELEKFQIDLLAYTSSNWIKVISPSNAELVKRLNLELDLGESEAIVLAQELSAGYLLIDERLGSIKAREAGLQTIGLLGVIAKAKEENLIAAARPLLQKLKEAGFWISDRLIHTILVKLNEV